jgi:hypothetical protein
MKINHEKRKGESGNVLFLILIAVALFAALSYAVTSSTRSGGGDAASETNLVNSAQLTQYPAGIRTSLVRMIIGGTGAESISFDTPSDFGSLANIGNNAFHPSGGGATYQTVPGNLMEAGTGVGVWSFNANFEIPQVGQDGVGGADLISFLPGISRGLCSRLNGEYSLTAGTATFSGIPDFDATDASIDDNHLEGDAFADPGETIDNATNDFNGQPFGCFYDNTRAANDRFVYYHVLIER